MKCIKITIKKSQARVRAQSVNTASETSWLPEYVSLPMRSFIGENIFIFFTFFQDMFQYFCTSSQNLNYVAMRIAVVGNTECRMPHWPTYIVSTLVALVQLTLALTRMWATTNETKDSRNEQCWKCRWNGLVAAVAATATKMLYIYYLKWWLFRREFLLQRCDVMKSSGECVLTQERRISE